MQTRTKATLALVLVVLAFTQRGPGSNDEMDQAAAFHALKGGSLMVHDGPAWIYSATFQGQHFQFEPRSNATHPVGSTFLNILALPLAWLGTFAALQATSTVLLGFTAWLLWPLLRSRTATDGTCLVFWLAVLVGPLMWWGQAAKYHALTACLAVCLVALQGRQGLLWNWVEGAVAGLSVWANIGFGAVAVLALAGTEIHKPRNWAPIACGLVAGLTPYFLENTFLFGSPWLPFYFHQGGVGSAVGGSWPVNLLAGYVAPWGQGTPIPVFWVSPLLAAALAWPWLKRWGNDQERFAACLVLAQAVLMTNAAVRQGFGHDMRLYAPILPALGVLAAAVVGRKLREPQRAVMLALGIAATLVGLTVLLDSNLGQRGHFLAYAGLGLGTIGALALLKWRVATVAVAWCLAMPMLWVAFFMLDLGLRPLEAPIFLG